MDKKVSMAATVLTPEGWSGATSGVWTKRANVVIDNRRGISVASGDELVNARGGDDVITGEQKDGEGVFISNDPRRANLQMGGGNDTLTGISENDIGILNRGFIYMGSGDDTIIGSGGKLGIRNRGFLYTQGGDDVVDVSRGGIRGRGFVDLGGGNDTFIGFGNHEVYGDAGKDTLLLPKGSYELSKRNSRRYRVERGDDRLEIIDFEVIGGINSKKSERLEIDKGGTLVVRNNGSITLT
jgi:hypothetical protein